MKAFAQHFRGSVITIGDRHLALLESLEPAHRGDATLVLRYAFLRQGPELPIVPAFVLDDWGSEIKGQEMFKWIQEFGGRFPRAEVFGFDVSGRQTQSFLRELELYIRLIVLAYSSSEEGIAVGRQIEAIVIPDSSVPVLRRVKRPEEVAGPLRSANVGWWRGRTDVESIRQVLSAS